MNSLSIEDLKILIADLLITMRCLELEKAKLQAKLDNTQRDAT